MASQLFTVPGSNFWICPKGVFSVDIATVWGAGGAGSYGAIANDTGLPIGGTGGGGGALAYSSNIPVIPGVEYEVFVGTGGNPNAGGSTIVIDGGPSWFITSGTLFADGGKTGFYPTNTPTNGGFGGSVGTCIGQVRFGGGYGGFATGQNTGAGGASGCTITGGYTLGGWPPSDNVTGGAGGIAPDTTAGNGGNGCSVNGTAQAGAGPGGGGGGGFALGFVGQNAAGAVGGNGQVLLQWTGGPSPPFPFTPLPMLHSPAQIVRSALIALGMGIMPPTSQQWPIYATNEPDTPDNCITVYDTVGRKAGRTMVDGEVQEYYGIQMRFRATDDPTCYAKAQTVAVTVDSLLYDMSITLDTATYTLYNVSRSGPVLSLGVDNPTTKRILYTINALATIRRIV